MDTEHLLIKGKLDSDPCYQGELRARTAARYPPHAVHGGRLQHRPRVLQPNRVGPTSRCSLSLSGWRSSAGVVRWSGGQPLATAPSSGGTPGCVADHVWHPTARRAMILQGTACLPADVGLAH